MASTTASAREVPLFAGIAAHYSRQNRLSRQDRASLARMISVLFDHWDLPRTTQACLLGLSKHSRSTLYRYRNGQPLVDSRDLLDRVANLLAIHANLRAIFPENRDLVYKWPTAPNQHFGDISPVDFMCRYGFIGVAQVRRYLDLESQK